MRSIPFFFLGLIGCAPLNHEPYDSPNSLNEDGAQTEDNEETTESSDAQDGDEDPFIDISEPEEDAPEAPALCQDGIISPYAAEMMVEFTYTTGTESIYEIQSKINGVADLFEECRDPWGLFPTTYKHITARGIRAVEEGDFEDETWARNIIVDFAGRYLENLRFALEGGEPSWAWQRYYELADREDVSKTRSVIVAMCAHLMLDLPHSLVAIETTEENKEDFFVFGDLMIEVSDDLIDDLWAVYETDAEAILNGFFVGNWVDGVFGEEAMITLSYQTVRTKSWNSRWYLEQSWGGPIADAEIYTSFWTVDAILRALDGANIID